jgi:radical SAM superfamily enzyme YgiQ (UPF0313 family)
VCLGCNYLANVPEIIETAKSIKTRLPGCFVFVGGHSASFVAADLLAQGAGAIDCVIEGEGEASIPRLLQAVQDGNDLTDVPGAISVAGEGPPPHFVESLDTIRPARPARTTAALLHWHARPLCFDRVRPRLSLGLHVLQRLDVLWPQLPCRLARSHRR